MTSLSMPSAITDRSNRAPDFIACMVTTTIMALILVSLRLYVRLAIVRKLGADDCTIVLAMVNTPISISAGARPSTHIVLN